jgi:Uncharacterised nucleotidyltransferase
MMNIEEGPLVQLSALAASFSADPLPASQSTATLPSAAPRFSREFNLLLACLNGAKTKDIRKLICDDLDWRSLLRLTEHHRLIPQVHAELCEVSELVPRATSERLRNRYEANVRHTLRLTRDLVRVLERFESRGIPVLAYKGPTLAAILHGDFTQRQYSDLDLLVHPSDVENSKSALFELGYKPGRSLTPRQEESYIRSGYEYVFDQPDARNVLELKWRILPHFYSIEFDVSGLFDRSILVEVSGHPMRTLCAEDLLLLLCVHAAKHAWSELSLLWDVSRHTRSQSINWNRVREQASQLGIRRILDMNLALAQNLMGNTVPSTGREQVESKRAIGLLMERILPVITHAQQVDTESISYFCLMLTLRERWRDRACFLWRLLLTPNIGEWSTVRLPSRLFPLYHLVRMYRLARRLMGFRPTREAEAEIPRPIPV